MINDIDEKVDDLNKLIKKDKTEYMVISVISMFVILTIGTTCLKKFLIQEYVWSFLFAILIVINVFAYNRLTKSYYKLKKSTEALKDSYESYQNFRKENY